METAMLKRTIRQYDIKHSGDEMDRLEILGALGALAAIVNEASLADVMVESVKSDVIIVIIEEVDIP